MWSPINILTAIMARVKLSYRLIGLIGLVWLMVFYFEEVYVPNATVGECSWSDPPTPSDSDTYHSSPRLFTNVMLVADPQLIDGHTYPGRGNFLLKVSEHTVDMYLHRNYKALLHQLKPDYVFFLGDLLDSARSSLDEYFYTQVARFNRIFDVNPKYRFGSNVFLNVPGNHDIGFGHQLVTDARERFTSVFGEPNTHIELHGVDFVSIDGLLLSSPDSAVNSAAFQFLDDYASERDKPTLRVLLSHVPLYRDPSVTPCRNPREMAPFALTKGHQYQLIIEQPLSERILHSIKPFLVFSGDDHDYCVVEHHVHNPLTKKDVSVFEYTVKSISMAMGIHYPAVQLLTYASIPDVGFTYSTGQCFLEQPYYNIAVYVVVAVVSGVVLLVVNLVKRRPPSSYIKAAANDEEAEPNAQVPSLRRLPWNVVFYYKIMFFFIDVVVTGLLVLAIYAIGFCWW